MIHAKQHKLAGKTVKIKIEANELGGQEYIVEDYWDRVSGKSWMSSNGNFACLNYAMRSGFSNIFIPVDNEVLYGKINGIGHLVHVNEIEALRTT